LAVHRSSEAFVDAILPLLPGTQTERDRFRTLVETLAAWKPLFAGRRILDFGASWGTSMVALLLLGSKEVIGVEPDGDRVKKGQAFLAEIAPSELLTLLHTPETASLPFSEGEFDFVLVNAVMEHIPQPRDAYVRELWRVLSPGGHLMVNETPNKYFPKEVHTTHLWFNHCLPSRIAHRRAVRRGRFPATRTDWISSGWRGLGYYELTRSCPGYRLVPENSGVRHRILGRLGLPASLLDPYPTWVLRKASSVPKSPEP